MAGEDLSPGEDALLVLWTVLRDAGADADALASEVVGRTFEILRDSGPESAWAFDVGLHIALHELDREVLFEQQIRDRGEDADRPPIPLSADTFLYARCAVLTSGQAVYEAVLADPERFASTWDLDAEALLELADAVLDDLGAEPTSTRDLPSYESGSNGRYWSSDGLSDGAKLPLSPLQVSWRGGWGNHPALILDRARLQPISDAVASALGRPGGALDQWREGRGLEQIDVGLSVPLDWNDRSDPVQVYEGALLVTVFLEQADLDLTNDILTSEAIAKVKTRLSEVAKRRRWPAIDWEDSQ
jgi:hypothetical protein